jgi:hypothetical protein
MHVQHCVAGLLTELSSHNLNELAPSCLMHDACPACSSRRRASFPAQGVLATGAIVQKAKPCKCTRQTSANKQSNTSDTSNL